MSKVMTGVDRYMTKDGIRVLRVHYSADPDRDPSTPQGMEWKLSELSGYPGGENGSKWKREQEIDFDVQGGELVFPDMEENKSRILIDSFEIPPSWRMAGSFDYAGRGWSAFLVHAWVPDDDEYYTVWEYFARNSGYIQTSEAIRNCKYFKRLEWIVADPSIWTPTQENKELGGLVSIAQLFAEQGIVFTKGKRGGDIEFAEMINDKMWGCMRDGEQPRYRIMKGCRNHWREMMKWRYSDYTASTQENRNLKETMVDRDNHTIDAAKYFFFNVNSNWMQEQGVDLTDHLL